jgi:hypothetical protein
MTRKTSNIVLVIVGIAAVVSFFLPFLDVGGLIQASGFDVLIGDNVPWTVRLALLALPIGGAVLIFAGATDNKKARVIGFGFGAGVYGYLGFQLVRAFIATTGIGLWVTLLAAAVAIVVALYTKRS